MLNSFETGFFLPDFNRGGNYEVEILNKYVSYSNYQTYIYQVLCLTVILSGMCGTLLERILNSNNSQNWTMPFLSFSLFPINRSPNYEIAWFMQSILRIIFSGIVSALDTLLGAILAHITAQCLLLQNAIRRINSHENNSLKNIIHYHWEILKLAKKFDRFFSYLLLSEFFGTLGILCFTMYHASLSDLLSRKAAQDFSYVSTISMQIFLCCYWGNEVARQSEAMALSCTEADFVGADLQFQKDLVFLIRNCQKPIVLTAGNFTELSLKTFVWILRASYSYYMVLRSNN
nr:putative odorant receptor 92a [Onthophagus taurus]